MRGSLSVCLERCPPRPFLKGLEVLPLEEGTQAVAQCEAAIKKCELALDAARIDERIYRYVYI